MKWTVLFLITFLINAWANAEEAAESSPEQAFVTCVLFETLRAPNSIKSNLMHVNTCITDTLIDIDLTSQLQTCSDRAFTVPLLNARVLSEWSNIAIASTEAEINRRLSWCKDHIVDDIAYTVR
ncbi:MAG: hypothetical protein AAF202_07965, partial [Pseudomonadota bacterium]